MRPPRGVARPKAADVAEGKTPAQRAGQSYVTGRSTRRAQAASTAKVVFSAPDHAVTGRRRLRKHTAVAGTAAVEAPVWPSAAEAELDDLELYEMPELLDAPDDPNHDDMVPDVNPAEDADQLLCSMSTDLCAAAAVDSPPAVHRRPRRAAANAAAAAVAAAATDDSDQELGDGQTDSPLVVKRRSRSTAVGAAAAAAADGDSDHEADDGERVAKDTAW